MKIILLVEGVRHPVDLTEEGITIGRGEAADMRIQSNAVSRVHAKFLLREGRVLVTDMRSLNGTSLNGAPVLEPVPLRPGDTVLLGEVPVQWLDERTEAAPLPPTLQATGRVGTEARIALEDRAFDASGSILVPHATIEAMLARHQAESSPAQVDSLFQRLAAMAGKLLGAAGLPELLVNVPSELMGPAGPVLYERIKAVQ